MTRFVRGLFRAGMALYPATFRERFGRDMEEVFADLLHDARRRGAFAGAVQAMRSLIFLIVDALRVRMEKRSSMRYSIVASNDLTNHKSMNPIADVRFAARALRKNPLFSTVAVLVIAIGTGAVTTIYSVANAIVLRPIPATSGGDRLVEITRTHANGEGTLSASYPYVQRLRQASRSFDRIAGWSMLRVGLGTGSTTDVRLANLVSDDYFAALGVQPFIGRFFTDDELREGGAAQVIVLGYGYWQAALGADRTILGRTVQVNGRAFTVVGVAPPSFRGVFVPLRTDAWIPLSLRQSLEGGGPLSSPGSATLATFGRLKEGASPEQAATELAGITRSFTEEASEPLPFRKYDAASVSRLSGLPSEATGAVKTFILLLFVASSMVLFISCVNVAAMLLSRNVTRRREIAVRIALGAAWHRVASLLLIENMMLFVLGAAGGMGLSIVTTRLMERFPLPVDLPIELELSPDFRVLAFALCGALVIGLVFGLIPALQATRANVNVRLRDGTAGAGARRSRLRNTLVVGQMTLSLVLLVGSALFLRALDRGRRVDPGFDVNQVITLQLDAQSYGYDESRGREFFRSLSERAALLPGVTGASFAKSLPLSNTTEGDGVYVPGYVGPESEDPSGVGVNLATVDKDFFEVLRIPILRGRGFSAADDATGAKVVVLSETLAKRFWPGAEAIGRSIRVGSDTVTVVGVARTAKFKSLSERDEPLLYLPLAQRYSPDRHLLVRSSANLASVEAGLRKLVQDLDPSLSPPAITLAEATAIALLPQRVAALVTGVLGMVGLLLATVGLYGVVAYSTSQRAREMGVRMALGATRRDVVGLVLGEGMRLVLVGGVAGIVVSFLATRVLAQFLFGVSSLDAVAFAGGGFALTLAMLLASYLPARRAADTDPMKVLRTE